MHIRPHHRWILAAAALLALSACKKTPPVGPIPDPPPWVDEVVDNPFADARFYVRQDWAQQVRITKRYAPDGLQEAVQQVSEQPVGIWLDRIAAIEGDGGPGLRDHLDQALRQQREAGGGPMVVPIVIYNLPDRDCAAAASAGELSVADGGLERYASDYVDAIADIGADPAYRNLRLVFFVEPDGLANLVTNLELPACAAAAPAYTAGVAHAVRTLSELPNAHLYLDMAHAGWLGWDHGARAALLYRQVLDQAGGEDTVRGFVTNVSNYVPMHEPFNPYRNADANREIIEGFYEWNPSIDGRTFVDSLRVFFPDHGFVVDTGRSGWARRPGERRDRRGHRSEWCNVVGPGLGERPQADPEPGIDAYFWVKPPGESDGSGNPQDPRSDPACNPEAPPAGQWFEPDFLDRVKAATPPFD